MSVLRNKLTSLSNRFVETIKCSLLPMVPFNFINFSGLFKIKK